MDKLIGKFDRKNRNEQVRIYTTEYYGQKYVNIRIYFSAKNQWFPTRKGVTIPAAEADALARFVKKAAV